MFSVFNDRSRETPLALNSDFGALDGHALELVQRRYVERGLAVAGERFSSRHEAGDVVCTAQHGAQVVGTLTVRFDGSNGLNADLLFGDELRTWRAAGVSLCEFGSLAVDRQAPDSRLLLARLFHLAYLHAHRRAGCERGVIEVHPRHVAFYRRLLGWLPHSTARHNPRVDAPAVLMSFELSMVRAQISRWGGQPALQAQARSLYPLAWDAATEAAVLAKLG
ncbi:N-acyl amino acid synthase FeeM domain-containing protein [Roseateles asaccharophilus]|uniref:N-acyl amino acid synthase FeeM catalytic core domain-containing protein n=1 Tax=Roseateles asaccharophilus TaxID=582607 RepID=A0ABU2A6T5_9BURK|nr:hypothetical protein [Roseateles asaccharophilus]MDR7332889.1 hypothetical protein [Roseateles asaccharophilus]